MIKKYMLEFKTIPSSSITLPKSANIQKIFLDTDGIVKVLRFDGSISSLQGTSKTILASQTTVEQLNLVLYPLFEYLTNLLNVESEITDEKLQVAIKIIESTLETQATNLSNVVDILNSNQSETNSRIKYP